MNFQKELNPFMLMEGITLEKNLLLLRKGLGLETEKVDLLSMFIQFNSTKKYSYLHIVS